MSSYWFCTIMMCDVSWWAAWCTKTVPTTTSARLFIDRWYSYGAYMTFRTFFSPYMISNYQIAHQVHREWSYEFIYEICMIQNTMYVSYDVHIWMNNRTKCNSIMYSLGACDSSGIIRIINHTSAACRRSKLACFFQFVCAFGNYHIFRFYFDDCGLQNSLPQELKMRISRWLNWMWVSWIRTPPAAGRIWVHTIN